jgi:hypothetical protein
MNYSGTATTNPYAFTLWPDASEEELAVWAQAAAHSQENNDFSLGDLDSALAWGQSATLPATTYDLQNNFVSTTGLGMDLSGTYTRYYRSPTGPLVAWAQSGIYSVLEPRSRMPPRQMPWRSRQLLPRRSSVTAWTR